METHSRHKSRLLREMSRDLNHSIASSTGSNHGTVSTDSTMTDFNPEKDDVIMSTRQLDTDLSNTNPKLPKLRDTAKKYGRWAPRQPDFVINTSALDRAFPDFTQGSIDEALDTESIEVGRGPKTRQRGSNRNPRLDYSDNFDSPIVVGDFQILRSPPRGHGDVTDPVFKETKRNNIQKAGTLQQRRTISEKENFPPNTQKSATGSPYISNASLTSGGKRRSLAELHAFVTDESNGSITTDSRPAHKGFQAKSTRFSSQSKPSPQAPVSKKQQLEELLAEKIRTASGTPSKGQAKKSSQVINTAASNTPNPTQQSFILPTMADVSHVVSAETGSGIPVVVRGGRVQPRLRNGFSGKFRFDDVDGIEVPDEEEDIYLSVDLLKSRVARLETEKADSQRTIDELKRDNHQLQEEKQEFERRRRSDSALGTTDGGSDAYSDRDRNIVAEKNTSKSEVTCYPLPY
jgi:FtsZ-binding cell division protein ZapB